MAKRSVSRAKGYEKDEEDEKHRKKSLVLHPSKKKKKTDNFLLFFPAMNFSCFLFISFGFEASFFILVSFWFLFNPLPSTFPSVFAFFCNDFLEFVSPIPSKAKIYDGGRLMLFVFF